MKTITTQTEEYIYTAVQFKFMLISPCGASIQDSCEDRGKKVLMNLDQSF